ncbi:hypothetical protein SprV_0802537300 [Sparganum proliferum]
MWNASPELEDYVGIRHRKLLDNIRVQEHANCKKIKNVFAAEETALLLSSDGTTPFTEKLWKLLLLCWLLLLLGSTLQGRRLSPSLEVTGITSTCFFFKWSDPPSGSALQHFLLRGTALISNKTVENRFGATEREGFLCNLEPYTNYAPSLIPVTRVHGHPIKTDPENVLTLSSAPSPTNLTAIVSSGSHSINMTWLPPVKPNGILEAYKAECYLPNDNTPVASVQVDPQVLSVEVSGLAPNTLYECAVVAFTKGLPGGQGGGQTSSKRSPAVRTWQSNLLASADHPDEVVTTDSNSEIDSNDSTEPHGTNTTVPLKSNERGPSEYVSVLGTSVTNVFEDVTTNSNDKINNQGSRETTENETQKFTFTLEDDIVENKLMEPTESAEQAPGSSAPGLSTTEINAVDAKIIDSDEDRDKRDSAGSNGNTTSAVILNSHVDLDGDVPTAPFESKEYASGSSAPGLSTKEINAVDAKIIDSDEDTDKRDTVGSDGNTTSAVIPTSDVDLGGDVPAAPFESNEDGSSVHVSAFNDSGDNLTAATIVDSENETDELDPRGSDGNKSGSSTPEVHEYSTEISSTIPVELDGHGILREKTFQPAAIILRVVGIVSLLALATGFLQGNLHIPFISDDLAIETIELLLQSKYDETENRLGHAQILQLLKLCLRTYFTFDGTIYEQVKDTPMGSPISGFIAEAVLQRLESLVFQHHRPKFWARYVEDTLVVIERDQVLTFKEHLNAVFPDIQFTMEEEENNQLAFLDVLVCRKDCGGLKTEVFREATNTMQILNFNGNHPISHKRSCVKTLYRRVETHCSEPEDKFAELQYLRRVFKDNGYPRNFVNRCIRKRDKRLDRTDTKSCRALPYIKNVLEAVSRPLTPIGVGVAHRLEATIRLLVMKPQDPLPRLETSGVVYRFWCSCGQSNYVGESGRQLRTRMA